MSRVQYQYNETVSESSTENNDDVTEVLDGLLRTVLLLHCIEILKNQSGQN